VGHHLRNHRTPMREVWRPGR